jgi:hypothetical protein
MSKSDQHESDSLKLYFQNIAAAGIGDAGGLQPSAAAGSIWVGLHTADPGETGLQNTNEATWTNYVRVAVVRSAAGWVVSGSAPTQAANAALVTFPQSGSGPQTMTHFSAGDDASGATKMRYSGALTTPLVVNNLEAPQFPIGTLIFTDD